MSNNPSISPAVRASLSRLRRMLRRRLMLRGVGVLVAVLIVGVFLSLGIDRGLDLTRVQRVLIDLLCLGGAAAAAWRYLLRPMRVPMDDEQLALVLEEHYPQLKERLISALELSGDRREKSDASPQLVARLIEQANALAGQLDVRAPLENRPAWRGAAMGCCALVVLVAFTAVRPGLVSLYLQRHLLLSDVAWPKRTNLRIAGGPNFRVVRGGGLNVIVQASGVLPEQVTFQMRFPVLGNVSENVGPSGGERGQFVKNFENVSEGFDFRVRGNDDLTAWQQVAVVEPPELVELGGTKYYPPYAGRPAVPLAAEHGVIVAPAGGTLLLSGRANKNLSAAKVHLDGAETALQIKSLTDGPTRGPVGVEGSVALPARGGRSSLLMEIELTDDQGVVNPRGSAYSLQIDPDKAPTIGLDKRSIRNEVTAGAILPLLIQAHDDYGLSALSAQVSRVTEASTQGSTTATSQPAADSLPIPLAGRPSDAKTQYEVDLAPLGLAVGSAVRVQVAAKDTLPPDAGGPNVTLSAALNFRIVSNDDLLAELVRREKELRQEFAQMVELQATAAARLKSARDQLATGPTASAPSNGSVSPEAISAVNFSQRDQRSIAAQCSVTARQFQQVLEELTYNRVGEESERMRLAGKIIQPLDEISQKPMTDVIDRLDQASNMTEAAALAQAVGESAGAMDELYRQLTGILAEMKQLESRQELARALRKVIADSERIQEEIRRAGLKDSPFEPSGR